MTAVIAFIFSPLGKALLVGLALVAFVGYIDRKATYRERAKCEAAKIQSKLDATNADLAIAKKAEQDAKVALEELSKERSVMEAQNNELAERIKKMPVADQCIIPDRSKWLRR